MPEKSSVQEGSPIKAAPGLPFSSGEPEKPSKAALQFATSVNENQFHTMIILYILLYGGLCLTMAIIGGVTYQPTEPFIKLFTNGFPYNPWTEVSEKQAIVSSLSLSDKSAGVGVWFTVYGIFFSFFYFMPPFDVVVKKDWADLCTSCIFTVMYGISTFSTFMQGHHSIVTRNSFISSEGLHVLLAYIASQLFESLVILAGGLKQNLCNPIFIHHLLTIATVSAFLHQLREQWWVCFPLMCEISNIFLHFIYMAKTRKDPLYYKRSDNYSRNFWLGFGDLMFPTLMGNKDAIGNAMLKSPEKVKSAEETMIDEDPSSHNYLEGLAGPARFLTKNAPTLVWLNALFLFITYFIFRVVLFPIVLITWLSDQLFFRACLTVNLRAAGLKEASLDSQLLEGFEILLEKFYTPLFTKLNSFIPQDSINPVLNKGILKVHELFDSHESLSNALGWVGGTPKLDNFPLKIPYQDVFPHQCENLVALYDGFTLGQQILTPLSMVAMVLMSTFWFSKIFSGYLKEQQKWLVAKGFRRQSRKQVQNAEKKKK